MPGGRLTREERVVIAEGLADGRSFTEIATRLDRPISTITREVGRNGGIDHYRADAAQSATTNRARRRRPAPRAATPDSGRDAAAMRDVADRFTELMVDIGLHRMTARVLASLYLTDSGTMTAAELVARLQVSPASISKAIGELERQQLIRREREPGGRRERYVIDPDAWFRSWLASARHNAMLADFATGASRTLGPDTPAGARFHDIGDFFDRVRTTMLALADQWRREFKGSTPEG